MTSGRRTRALREQAEREGRTVRQVKRDPGNILGPAQVGRQARRRAGFRGRAPRSTAIGPAFYPRAKASPSGWPTVTPKPRSISSEIRRAAARNAVKPRTRAEILAQLRDVDPSATRGRVSAAKRRMHARGLSTRAV